MLASPPVSDLVFSLLLNRIQQGVYPAGKQLPSENSLATELNVSRSSIRTALAKLEATGYIKRHHGEGTYVRKHLPKEPVSLQLAWDYPKMIEDYGYKPRIEAQAIDIRNASNEEIQTLGLEPNNQVVQLERIFYAENDPLVFSTCIIPTYLYKDLNNLDGAREIFGFIKDYCDIDIDFIDSSISAYNGNPAIEKLLKLEPLSPLLRFEELFYRERDKAPIVIAESYMSMLKIKMQRIRSVIPEETS
jgi:GntR family transcriptional regulator